MRFATGTGGGVYLLSVWSITNGKKLVGPLRHGNRVTGIKFSPNGEQIATASIGNGSIRVFDSRNGNGLITIQAFTPSLYDPSTPLAWSNDGQKIFAVSTDKRIKSFDASTGSKIAESRILNGSEATSIALAANGKFIAAYASCSISFLDTLTLSRIDPVIDDSEKITSIAISTDCSYLATGRTDGKVVVRNIGNILPDLRGPFHASVHEQGQPEEQPSTSGDHDNNPPHSTPEKPRKSSSLQVREPPLRTLMKISSRYLFVLHPRAVEVPSSTPAPQFDFDEVGDYYILSFPLY
ncbi:WD40-repeat-containing domain protein [Lanmaoa asiatica]|nr:WD40-repeat-containing domain protein [Lanmaoa asiatica]